MFKRRIHNWLLIKGQPVTDLDRKILAEQEKGHLVPKRKLIKTPEQIEGIRRSGVVNTGVLDLIEREIKEMPNYFADYDTTVHFISEEELQRDHSGIPHGGFVLRSGKSMKGNNFLMEFSLKLDSNPEFTSSVLVAYARAVYRLHAEGKKGAVTAFDIAPKYLSPLSEEEQRSQLL